MSRVRGVFLLFDGLLASCTLDLLSCLAQVLNLRQALESTEDWEVEDLFYSLTGLLYHCLCKLA